MTPAATVPSARATVGDAAATGQRTRARLSSGAGVSIALAVASVATSATAAQADDSYTVRSGDNVSHIAQRTGATVAAIAKASGLADAGHLRIGQVLTIPTGSPAAAPVAASIGTAAASTYTVARGDTVSSIASRFGSTIAAVRAANGLDSRAFIRIGQVLTIPGGVPTASSTTAAPTGSTSTYTVRSGDTVSTIATRFGSTIAAVRAANGLDSRAFIRIGQALTIPTTPTGTPGTPAPAMTLVSNTFAGRTYAPSVVSSANANKSALLQAGVPSATAMRAKVEATARSMGVDPRLALAIAFQESGFNHTSVSAANAIGTMQVIPSSGDWASQMVGRKLNLLNPDDNVVAGVAILRSLVRSTPDLSTAIASYYQGASSVRRNGMFADTRRYVASVQTLMSRFG